MMISTDSHDEEISAKHLTATIVAMEPDKYLEQFVEYWLLAMPKDEDLPPIHVEEMQFWAKKHKERATKKTRPARAAHRNLPGLCRTWTNQALDFCIAHNFWPVRVMTPHQ